MMIRAIAVLSLALVPIACSGGGGDPEGRSELQVEDVSIGRGIATDRGVDVRSPLTYAHVDPHTGLASEESLRPLDPVVQVDRLLTFSLGEDYDAPVLPRNGVLVLRFSSPLDPASIHVDENDDHGEVVREGSVRILDPNGQSVKFRTEVDGDRLFILPFIAGAVGWPSTSLGSHPGLSVLLRSGADGLRSARGRPLRPRIDRWGEVERPITLRPGNRELDFIEVHGLLPHDRTYNGFLPDDRSPRLIRDHEAIDTLDPSEGDSMTPWVLVNRGAHYETRANDGLGEWAGAKLWIRPGQETERTARVSSHTRDTLTLDRAIEPPLRHGESFLLKRTEWFEPDPLEPLEEARFDPFNPENEANRDLLNFLRFRALGDDGEPVGEMLDPYAVLPSRIQITAVFDEPMDVETAHPFENFLVSRRGPPDQDWEPMVGALRARRHQSALDFRPVMTVGGEAQTIGLGRQRGERRVSLLTVPSASTMLERFGIEVTADVLKAGYRALTDLAGRPLAHGWSGFRPEEAHVSYTARFVIDGEEEGVADIFVMSQAFRGQADVVVDSDTETLKVRYQDEARFYGPWVADYDLSAEGYLASFPPRHFQRVLDDETAELNAWPFGVSAPLGGYVYQQKNWASLFGARFQHLYRNLEISPFPDAPGLDIELTRISWCPSGGHVEDPPDIHEDLRVALAHSSRGNERGLNSAWDRSAYDQQACGENAYDGPNYDENLQVVVPAGTTYTVERSQLFTPPTTTRRYIPWPEFETPFAYDNERALLIEYRLRPQTTLISFANSFTFAPVTLAVPTPHVRVWSFGSQGNTMDPYDTSDPRTQCASGPSQVGFGDNSVYFSTFDWTKRRAVLESPLFDVGESVHWKAFVSDPPLEEIPLGTTATFQYRGSFGQGFGPWVDRIEDLDSYSSVQFRLLTEGDFDTGASPRFDSVAFIFEK